MKVSKYEKIILKMRDEGKTFEEIGKEFCITRDRVRQIETRARQKIYNDLIENQQYDKYLLKLLPDGDIEILGYYDDMPQAFSCVYHKSYNPSETIEENLLNAYETWERLTQKAYDRKRNKKD